MKVGNKRVAARVCSDGRSGVDEAAAAFEVDDGAADGTDGIQRVEHERSVLQEAETARKVESNARVQEIQAWKEQD